MKIKFLKLLGQKGRNQPASHQNANLNEESNPFMRRGRFSKRIIGLTILGILTLLVIFAYNFLYLPYNYLKSLPNLNLTGVEEQVTEKIQKLRQEVEKNPDLAEAWGKLAMNLAIHDLKSEAIPCYKQAAALDATDFRWAYFSAIVLYEIGEEEALDWFERSYTLNPDYMPASVRHGQALYNYGKIEESSKVYKRAIAKDPQASYAYFGLAQNALSQGNLDSSQQYLQKSLDIEPQLREAHGLLAQVYQRLNQQEKASKELQLVEQLPEITTFADSVYDELIAEGISALWYRERGLAYLTKGHFDKAIHEFEMALELKPDPQGHNYIGELLLNNKIYPAAVRHFQSAINFNPYYSEAFNNMGKTLYEMGQTDQAYIWIEKALRLKPAFPEAYLNLSNLYKQSAKTSEAIEILHRGMKATRNYPPVALSLARLLATSSESEFRDGAEAVRLAKFVCDQANFKNAEALDVLATAYAEIGQFGQAVRTAEEALGLIDTTRQIKLADQIEHRIRLFKSNKPFRDE